MYILFTYTVTRFCMSTVMSSFKRRSLSCLLHSSMYQVLSIITVPEPLSAGFITMSCRCLSWRIACRSEEVRLSRIGLGLHVVMSSLTASKNVSTACSLLVGGFQVLLSWKGLSRLFTLVVLFSSKKYSVRKTHVL